MTPSQPTAVTLASKSTTRARLLADAGVAFDTVSPGVDETAAKESFLAEGMKPREIADALGIGYKTVANLCTAIKSKVGAARNADLVRMAIEAGIS